MKGIFEPKYAMSREAAVRIAGLLKQYNEARLAEQKSDFEAREHEFTEQADEYRKAYREAFVHTDDCYATCFRAIISEVNIPKSMYDVLVEWIRFDASDPDRFVFNFTDDHTDLWIRENGNTAFVYAPYIPEFIKRIRLDVKNCHWDQTNKCYKIPKNEIDTVRKIFDDVFGYTDLSTEVPLCTVQLEFTTGDIAYRDPIVYFGKIIASAYDRDSGAQAGDEVTFLQKRPSSGGTNLNWTTLIPVGAVVEIKNVPRAIVEAKRKTYENNGHIKILSVIDTE